MDEIERNSDKDSKNGSALSSNGDKSVQKEEEADELLSAAVDIILESGQASVSMLQRRLKLGYSRAARLVDQMEERGIVGPFEGSKRERC
jgi:S-DNA-T family DNA segregation ATPase FtsK/SpoIIIE